MTEADLFLLPTVERFDAVYATLFRCTGVRVAELPHLQRWLRDMRRLPGVRGSFDAHDALRSYYEQLFPLNPSRIVPVLPHWQCEMLSAETAAETAELRDRLDCS